MMRWGDEPSIQRASLFVMFVKLGRPGGSFEAGLAPGNRPGQVVPGADVDQVRRHRQLKAAAATKKPLSPGGRLDDQGVTGRKAPGLCARSHGSHVVKKL